MPTLKRFLRRPHLYRRGTLVAAAAVVGPGVLAGLSDDDPPGITTYSILGTDYGYRLLWVLLLSTGALIVFHELGARMGVATGRGLTGLVRARYGQPAAYGAAATLVVANIGTTCAELAGVAAACGLAGIPRILSIPIAAVAVSVLVIRGTFHRIEHLLLALSAVLAAYIVSGLIAGPNWGAAGRGLVVPSIPFDRHALLVATATLGTTLAPWGLAFLQSYAVDKKLRVEDWRFERLDVIAGAVMTGVVGFFVVVACAETLHTHGTKIKDASDAAVALRPLAGHLASTLFGAGLLGAALLGAAILPLSTAYSIAEAAGRHPALDERFRQDRLFYVTYGTIIGGSAVLVMAPGVPLVPVLFLTQALNAVLLLPLLGFIIVLARDRELMGPLVMRPRGTAVAATAFALVASSVAALAVLAVIR